MLLFASKKGKKAGCVSVGAIFCASVGHYIKEIKSDV
ncbi:hypothetical protein IGI58_000297 [Enterococcus sp. AZ020]